MQSLEVAEQHPNQLSSRHDEHSRVPPHNLAIHAGSARALGAASPPRSSLPHAHASALNLPKVPAHIEAHRCLQSRASTPVSSLICPGFVFVFDGVLPCSVSAAHCCPLSHHTRAVNTLKRSISLLAMDTLRLLLPSTTCLAISTTSSAGLPTSCATGTRSRPS